MNAVEDGVVVDMVIVIAALCVWWILSWYEDRGKGND